MTYGKPCSVICRIAELTVDIPTAGGMAPRCEGYLARENKPIDIALDASQYQFERIPDDPELVAYLDSGFQFYRKLLSYNGMMLHASAVAMEDRAYLFSGPCGVGKSTHTSLWQQVFGDAAQVFNDDKPALRRLDGCWYAYGTPWCGKDGINQNKKVPLAGICFMKQGQENVIRALPPAEALGKVLSQTPRRFDQAEQLDQLLGHVENLVREIPIFELQNRPEPDAAWLSYETMRCAAEKAGL